MIPIFVLSTMQQEQMETPFPEEGQQMARQLFTHFPRSVLDLKIFCERSWNETEILVKSYIQNDTSFDFFSRAQFTFVLCAVVFGILLHYLIRPRDYSPRSKEVSYVLDSIYDALPRNLTRRNKLEDLSKVIQRSLKVGNIPPPYPNGWFILLESDDVGKNQVKYVAALGENFAVFRTSEGEVHVMDAYCPHLGANLAIGGKVKGNCLECPFHGWQFDGSSGQCTKVPYSEKVPDFARVRTWKSCETSGCVFVWYHAEGEEPTWEPRCSWEDKVVEGKLWYVGRFQHMIKCHIQEIWENVADWEHFNVVHRPMMFGGSGIKRIIRKVISMIFCSSSKGLHYEVEDPVNKPHEVTIKMAYQFHLFGGLFTLFNGKFTLKLLGPGYLEAQMVTPLGTMYVVNGITPSEPLLLKSVTRAYTPPLCLLYARIFMPFACENYERDLVVWEHQKHLDKPILLKPDEHIADLRRWYAQFYTANSLRYTSQQKSMDW